MLLMFQAVFFVAEPASAAIDWVNGWLGNAVTRLVPEGMLRSLLITGVIGGVGGVLVFLPQIFTLFFFIAVLEDCGYMARAAYLMDKLMSRIGLSGKSFIPLLSSFACAVPGIMATRVIENRRDRLVTILVAPLMSCSARLPVYTLLIAAFVSIVVWALCYWPHDRSQIDPALLQRKATLEQSRDQWSRSDLAIVENEIAGQYLAHSFLGRMGKWIEPAVKPLGWDWRIGCAA